MGVSRPVAVYVADSLPDSVIAGVVVHDGVPKERERVSVPVIVSDLDAERLAVSVCVSDTVSVAL